MCDGNAIVWSDENCEYNLVPPLDCDGDNRLMGDLARPDPGKPAIVDVFEQSCHGGEPYRFELVLD